MPESVEQSNTTSLPENATVDEAVALMANLEGDDDDSPPAGKAASGDADADSSGESGTADDEVAASGDQDAQPEGEGEAEAEAGEEEAPLSDAPEFWSAEDKQILAAAPADVRAALTPLLKKYEQQRIEFVNTKTREASEKVKAAEDAAKQAAQFIQEGVSWWQQNGPVFQERMQGKWAGYTQEKWAELARENPAEWAARKQEFEADITLLHQANQRRQADETRAQENAAREIQEAKRVEHEKLASKLPTYFGTPEVSAKTYDDLGKFLFAKGIPADRINSIHEAPIIEIALNAMRYEQAQKKASPVMNQNRDGTGKFTAAPTPKRVQPGPAARPGNRQAEATRQVRERFVKSGGNSIADAAELIRLSGL